MTGTTCTGFIGRKLKDRGRPTTTLSGTVFYHGSATMLIPRMVNNVAEIGSQWPYLPMIAGWYSPWLPILLKPWCLIISWSICKNVLNLWRLREGKVDRNKIHTESTTKIHSWNSQWIGFRTKTYRKPQDFAMKHGVLNCRTSFNGKITWFPFDFPIHSSLPDAAFRPGSREVHPVGPGSFQQSGNGLLISMCWIISTDIHWLWLQLSSYNDISLPIGVIFSTLVKGSLRVNLQRVREFATG